MRVQPWLTTVTMMLVLPSQSWRNSNVPWVPLRTITVMDHPLLVPKGGRPIRRQPTQATATPILPDAGRPWRCERTTKGSQCACRGRPCRTEGSTGPPAALRLASPALPQVRPPRRLHSTRLHGRRQAWCWRDRAWRNPGGCFAANFGWNYVPPARTYRAGPKGPESGPSEGNFRVPHGKWFSSWPTSISLKLAGDTGQTGSTRLLMKDAPGGVHLPHEPRCRDWRMWERLTTAPRRWLLGRPRSQCTVRFQALPTLHPLGPSLRPRRRLKLPLVPASAQPCRSASDDGPRADANQGCGAHCRACTGTSTAIVSTHPKPHKPLTPKHHPPKPPKSMSQAGPKSGCCLPLSVMMLTHSIEGAVGVRVASIAAVEAGPGASPGKHCSRALSMPLTQAVPRFSEKRAYRRARLRAARAGGTYYRGRWHSAASLQTLPYTPPQAAPRFKPRRARQHAGATSELHCLSWNAGGLHAGLYQELVAWLEVQSKIPGLRRAGNALVGQLRVLLREVAVHTQRAGPH